MYGHIYCDPLGFVAQQIQEDLLQQAQADHLRHKLMAVPNTPKKPKRSSWTEPMINLAYFPQSISAKDI